MTRTKKLLWIGVAVIGVLDCAFYLGRIAKGTRAGFRLDDTKFDAEAAGQRPDQCCIRNF